MDRRVRAVVFLSMKDAAKFTGLARCTLYRLERRGLLSLERMAGRAFVSSDELVERPILTLGKAAKLVDRSWWTARRWRDAGILSVMYEFPRSKGRCSIVGITQAKEKWSKRHGGVGAKAG